MFTINMVKERNLSCEGPISFEGVDLCQLDKPVLIYFPQKCHLEVAMVLNANGEM